MSRPASASAEYGFSPATGSVVDFWKNSGTISTKPPTLTTSSTRTMSQGRLLSTCSCDSFMASVLYACAGTPAGIGASYGLAPATVLTTFQAMISMPARNIVPPSRRIA